MDQRLRNKNANIPNSTHNLEGLTSSLKLIYGTQIIIQKNCYLTFYSIKITMTNTTCTFKIRSHAK